MLVSARGSASPRAGAWAVTLSVLRKCQLVRWRAELYTARWRIVLDCELCLSDTFDAPSLRPLATLLHNAPFCEVVASRYAKATLDVVRRFAPSRVYKTGVM